MPPAGAADWEERDLARTYGARYTRWQSAALAGSQRNALLKKAQQIPHAGAGKCGGGCAPATWAVAYFFLGTFFPALRAWDRPIAIACFLLFTFLPLPLLSVSFLRSCIALPTLLDAAFAYFLAAMTVAFRWLRITQRQLLSSGSWRRHHPATPEVFR